MAHLPQPVLSFEQNSLAELCFLVLMVPILSKDLLPVVLPTPYLAGTQKSQRYTGESPREHTLAIIHLGN